jgi:hypothetical protein
MANPEIQELMKKLDTATRESIAAQK